jgi:HAD superfamily hydrolase (TIGR01484 family)
MTKPLLKAITDNCLGDIRLIASDMDGTLTQNEKFDSNLIQTLEKLAAARINVLIVTGRSAGWVNAIATYLPVVGAIAENGGILYWHDGKHCQFLIEISDLEQHRQKLATVFELLKTKFPQIEESEDNRFRLTDWTFDVEGLNPTELNKMSSLCLSEGWSFTYSNVQCHIKTLQQDKAIALKQVIQQYFPDLKPEQIITIGDSPNDESLFVRAEFPISVGVANILDYRDRLQHLPVYVTKKSEGSGFCELAELVINTNKSTKE